MYGVGKCSYWTGMVVFTECDQGHANQRLTDGDGRQMGNGETILIINIQICCVFFTCIFDGCQIVVIVICWQRFSDIAAIFCPSGSKDSLAKL